MCLCSKTHTQNIKMWWPPQSHCLASTGLACHSTLSTSCAWLLKATISQAVCFCSRQAHVLLLTYLQVRESVGAILWGFHQLLYAWGFSMCQRWIVACLERSMCACLERSMCAESGSASLSFRKRGSDRLQINRTKRGGLSAAKRISVLCNPSQRQRNATGSEPTSIQCVIPALRCGCGFGQFPVSDDADWYNCVAAAWACRFSQWPSQWCAVRGWPTARASTW